MVDTTFARVIEDHLELKRRNSEIDNEMPITRYRVDDPFENHPLFKSEEQARIEDTLDGVQPHLSEETVLTWPPAELPEGEESEENLEDSFWGRSRDFDWGD
jgi:hypothetical protein